MAMSPLISPFMLSWIQQIYRNPLISHLNNIYVWRKKKVNINLRKAMRYCNFEFEAKKSTHKIRWSEVFNLRYIDNREGIGSKISETVGSSMAEKMKIEITQTKFTLHYITLQTLGLAIRRHQAINRSMSKKMVDSERITSFRSSIAAPLCVAAEDSTDFCPRIGGCLSLRLGKNRVEVEEAAPSRSRKLASSVIHISRVGEIFIRRRKSR